MKPESLDRDGCTLRGKRITYQALTSRYVCDECGGKLVHRIVREDDQTVDRVTCAECEGDEIISEYRYLEQIAEGREVLMSLPPELRELLEPDRPQIDAEQAIKDLFG